MKRLYLIIASVIAMSLTIDADAQISVGVGYAHENISTKISGQTDEAGDSQGLDGVYIEATYEYNILNRKWGVLSLQPGLRFTLAGDSDSEREMGFTMKESYTETYFDIPVLVKYSYPLGSMKISAFAGPVLSVGMSSVNKLTASGDNYEYSQTINMYTGKIVIKGDSPDGSYETGLGSDKAGTDYGRFNLKLGLGIGTSFKDRFNVKLGYDIGLLNRYTGEKNDYVKTKIHTGLLYLGVGYTF